MLIDGMQVRLFAEDDIGGVFALIHDSLVSGVDLSIDRAALT